MKGTMSINIFCFTIQSDADYWLLSDADVSITDMWRTERILTTKMLLCFFFFFSLVFHLPFFFFIFSGQHFSSLKILTVSTEFLDSLP